MLINLGVHANLYGMPEKVFKIQNILFELCNIVMYTYFPNGNVKIK